MPFQKGNPGKPKGARNKATADVRALAGEYGPEAVETLARIMRGGETEAGRVAACKELLDRAYGKAKQPVDTDGLKELAAFAVPLLAQSTAEWLQQRGE